MPHGGHNLRRRGVKLLPGFGENQCAMPAMKQRHAQLVFELLDLAAHRRLREKELVAGLGEREMARRRLEAGEEVEAGYHIPISHECLENLPFERGLRR